MARKMMRSIALGLLFGTALGFGQNEDSSNASLLTVDTLSSVASNKETPFLAAVAAPTDHKAIQNKQNLFFALDEGQIMRGAYNSGATYTAINRTWQERMTLHLANDMTYQDRMHFILSFECQLSFSFLPYNSVPATLTPQFNFYPNDVEINYSFGQLDKPWMKLAVGYFPFKYNPDAKDLGEYLMRSNAYPSFIVNDFEFPMTRELGLHISGNSAWLFDQSIDKINWDILLTSETHAYSWPTQDWTLTAVASNSLLNCLDIGGGVSFQRLLSVDESKTSPEKAGYPNMYYGEGGKTDTQYISFKATKLMGRASINPQRFIPEFKIPFWPLFGETPIFGKEDLKVYGEVAVLGLKNYVAYGPDSVIVDSATNAKAWLPASKIPINNYARFYDSLADRMPYMIGIDLPTHPLLSYGIIPFLLTKWLRDETGDDIRPLSYVLLIPALASGFASHYLGWDLGLDEFSLECEWASQRFPNSNQKVITFGTATGPMPIPVPDTRSNFGITPMQVKYALYFKKSFKDNRFALSGLVGRDHMKPSENAPPVDQQTDDFLQTKNQWWWMLRFSAQF